MRAAVRAVVIATACAGVAGAWLARSGVRAQEPNAGWKLPADAATVKNPLPMNEAMLAAGRKLFASKCQRCHGPKGKGDGPDATGDHAETMDLTNPARGAHNPDGIVFHKIRTGRVKPRMPAFAEELTPEQTWAIVAFVQSLRAR
jgi:mono/diheme cytochrome c family protein